MNLNLRQAIIQQMQGKSDEEMRDVIEGSIDSDERALPGLGVLFEIIWKNIEEDVQNQLVSTLKGNIPG